MMDLSDREQIVLVTIETYHRLLGRSPSLRELACAMGRKDSCTAARVVSGLRQREILRRSFVVPCADHSAAGGFVISREAQIHLQSQASL